jgi:uncharacterized membrane protein
MLLDLHCKLSRRRNDKSTESTLDLMKVLQGCCKDVTRVLQGCYKGVTRMLQGCYKGVTMWMTLKFVVVCCVIVFCYKVLLKLHGKLSRQGNITRVLQECANQRADVCKR